MALCRLAIGVKAMKGVVDADDNRKQGAGKVPVRDVDVIIVRSKKDLKCFPISG